MKKWLWIPIGVIIVVAGIFIYVILTPEINVNPVVPSNFEECIAAGNPAMESYPRQCRDPIGDRTFTEEIENNNLEICDCSANLYNCDDFETQNSAQECFHFCNVETGRDIHGLDNDGDGSVCEGLS